MIENELVLVSGSFFFSFFVSRLKKLLELRMGIEIDLISVVGRKSFNICVGIEFH